MNKQKWSSSKIEASFCPVSSEDQKKKKVFCDQTVVKSKAKIEERYLLNFANANWGRTIFYSSAEIGLKSAKNVVFSIFCNAMEKATAPLPAPSCAIPIFHMIVTGFGKRSSKRSRTNRLVANNFYFGLWCSCSPGLCNT